MKRHKESMRLCIDMYTLYYVYKISNFFHFVKERNLTSRHLLCCG